MDIDVVTTIYRVAHEALANVAEHAKASNVSVRLETDNIGRNGEHRRTPDAVVLSITDDGIGVDPDRLDRRSDGHLGLRLLTTRVEDLGGTLSVTLGPDGGTDGPRTGCPLDPDKLDRVPTAPDPSALSSTARPRCRSSRPSPPARRPRVAAGAAAARSMPARPSVADARTR